MTSSIDKVWRATLSCPSLPTDGDLVSQGEGWFMDWSMRLTDLWNSTFTSRTHPLELGGVRKKCAQGGVSSVAEDLRAASPVSPVFLSVDHVQRRPDLAAWSTLPTVAKPCA